MTPQNLLSHFVDSTHDWTATGPGEDFTEAWADVKSPGNQRVYSVGTITVRTTAGNPQFSGAAITIAGSPGVPSFNFFSGTRQVVALQCVNDLGVIQWQRYFYGTTGSIVTRASNARAISVWPEATDADTRIAICGETYDSDLPLSPTTFSAATATRPTGFIAVFDGAGALLWTHHLFGVDPTQSCAITDISMRVELEGAARREVVTYCGISTHGNPGPGTPLSPELPFSSEGPFMSSGATHHGTGQWDGIVGRVHRNTSGATIREFHSIVGGPGQDGLFGIVEIDGFRFVAVGNTVQASVGPVANGFPFPGAAAMGMAGPHAFGTALLFDALETRTGPPPVPAPPPPATLHLDDARQIGGTTGELAWTLARDVIVAWHSFADSPPTPTGRPWHTIHVVGSTSDAAAFSGASFGIIHGSLQGLTDGFVAAFIDSQLGVPIDRLLVPLAGTFHGGAGEDGLTGIQSWNEFSGHYTAAGFGDTGAGVRDLTVQTFFYNNGIVTPPAIGFTGPLNGTDEILPIRYDWAVSTFGAERPAVVGAQNATAAASGHLFVTGPGQLLDDPAGGGVAVDERGRATVVGQTDGPIFPYDPLDPNSRLRDPAPGPDAVRTAWDTLPWPAGRTDRTGTPVVAVPAPLGGTTPACALDPFGMRITVANPLATLWTTGILVPDLMRMLIDYEGDQVPLSTTCAVLVSTPTPQFSGMVSMGILQLGLPMSVPITGLYGMTETWWTGGAPIFVFVANEPWRVFRVPLPPGLMQQVAVTAQLVTVLSVPVGSGGACSSLFSASPALWFLY